MVNERLSRNEREFVRSCLQEGGLRADGRSLDGTRPLTVRLGPAPGLAEVTLGSTRCVAQVAVDATTPFPDRPEEGLVTISAQFSSLAGEQFTAPTWYGMRDDELTRSIERTMRDTRAIESESLCILAGKLVWAVRISVQIIDYDGNALDAATAAVSAALLHARRPDVTISGDDVRIHSAEEREPVPLPVVHTPVTASFATFEDTASGRIYLALDPSLQEEGAMDGSLSLSANIHQEICGIYKAGGVPLEAATILRCAQLTLARAEEVTLDIQQALRLQPTAGMLTLGSVVPDTVTDLSEPNTAEPSPTENNAPGPKRQKRSVAGEHPASSGDNDLQPPPNQYELATNH
mmetsp:Transcript_4495/g.8948  ORF Transcript_4495/g.8948 Transcript_4495/m.8948 type:complete len:349 (-) Transcript_4495:1891-2937(-)